MEIRSGDLGAVRYTPLGKPLAATPGAPDFGETFKSALGEVNRLQLDAGEKTRALLAGEDVDLHQVMISAEEASVAFDLMMEIRNKLIEAYQEIQRMNV
ncbi:MAG: flagellar hook-basal body complex protein FliE [Gemmatimonadetes bacterium]|nr:flagellar hook-basal body complex protein FliE [Gemmatimonadota bacterium]